MFSTFSILYNIKTKTNIHIFVTFIIMLYNFKKVFIVYFRLTGSETFFLIEDSTTSSLLTCIDINLTSKHKHQHSIIVILANDNRKVVGSSLVRFRYFWSRRDYLFSRVLEFLPGLHDIMMMIPLA